jgi:RimJ/RimL family protein N-acetyltransferase
MDPIHKYGLVLRLVEESDAEFILSLRTNPSLGKYLSHTSNSLSDQIKWLKQYKIKELAGLEYYFISEDIEGNRYGTVRLYNFDESSFEIGSWLFLPKSPLGMAVKTHFLVLELGFNLLNADFARTEIRKLNGKVVRYMNDFETTLVKEDNLNFYFTLTKENFFKRRNKLSKFLNG